MSHLSFSPMEFLIDIMRVSKEYSSYSFLDFIPALRFSFVSFAFLRVSLGSFPCGFPSLFHRASSLRFPFLRASGFTYALDEISFGLLGLLARVWDGASGPQ